jgi:hypothetical protein
LHYYYYYYYIIGYGLDAEKSEFGSRQRQQNFLFSTPGRPAQGSTQSIQRALEATYEEIRLPGHEADHSSASNVEVNNACCYTFSPS